MLDGLGRQDVAGFDAAEAGAARAARLTGLAIWLNWDGDESVLRQAVARFGCLEQFTLIDLSRPSREPGVWLCKLRYLGRGPDQDDHVLSLLRRLSATASWRRVERVPLTVVQAGDDEANLLWEAMSRRPLP